MESRPRVLPTSVGDLPLHDYRLRLAGREWSILHTEAILTRQDEARFLDPSTKRLPYGVALWPAAIGLAHEIAIRADDFRGRRVLELGAGTGLPGVVAASLGARVVQTDRHAAAMFICRANGRRNGVRTIEYRLADWADWRDGEPYDWVIGADILYREPMHAHLRRIFESNVEKGGRVLLSDPLRATSLRLLETMERDGWEVTMTKWNVGEHEVERAVGVFELVPP